MLKKLILMVNMIKSVNVVTRINAQPDSADLQSVFITHNHKPSPPSEGFVFYLT